MNWQAAGIVLGVCSLLVSAGLLAWFGRARSALMHAELDKRYATNASVTAALDEMRREINGARGAIRRDMASLNKQVEGANAAAGLAVKNADDALQEAQETRTLLEHYHDRIMDDFAKPMERLSDVLRSLSNNVASQGAALNMLIQGAPRIPYVDPKE